MPFFGNNLNKTLESDPHTQPSQLGGSGGGIKSRGRKQRVINIREGMKRDTILRQESEISISRIINHGGGDEAARGRDESGRATISPLGNNKTTQKRAARASNVDGGIGMNINIVKI